MPEDCFVKLDWERNGDSKYVQEKLEYAWEHRERLSKNARKKAQKFDWEIVKHLWQELFTVS